MSAADSHVEEAERLMSDAMYPRRWITGTDQEPPSPDEMGPMTAVTVDDAKWDPSPAFLAAQVHATLAQVEATREVAVELAEANRIARLVASPDHPSRDGVRVDRPRKISGWQAGS